MAGQEKGGNPEEEKKDAMRSARPPRAVGTACEVLREREKRRVYARWCKKGDLLGEWEQRVWHCLHGNTDSEECNEDSARFRAFISLFY